MLAKVFLWSWGRRREIAGLKWADARIAGSERHFESIGKWGVDKWFRIPQELYDELLAVRTNSPFVFAAFNQQLRKFHQNGPRPWLANRVLPVFVPENLGDWFYNQIVAWSKTLPRGPACTHIFRKTTLQYARRGEDANRLVAQDARVGEGVMMTSYVKETDEELRQKSNRTFHRIHASLPPEVARRFGYAEPPVDPLRQQIGEAMAAGNWDLVTRLSLELARRDQQRAG
jgi:integrase